MTNYKENIRRIYAEQEKIRREVIQKEKTKEYEERVHEEKMLKRADYLLLGINADGILRDVNNQIFRNEGKIAYGKSVVHTYGEDLYGVTQHSKNFIATMSLGKESRNDKKRWSINIISIANPWLTDKIEIITGLPLEHSMLADKWGASNPNIEMWVSDDSVHEMKSGRGFQTFHPAVPLSNFKDEIFPEQLSYFLADYLCELRIRKKNGEFKGTFL